MLCQMCHLAVVILKAAVCGAVELYCIILTGVSIILPTPCILVRVAPLCNHTIESTPL